MVNNKRQSACKSGLEIVWIVQSATRSEGSLAVEEVVYQICAVSWVGEKLTEM